MCKDMGSRSECTLHLTQDHEGRVIVIDDVGCIVRNVFSVKMEALEGRGVINLQIHVRDDTIKSREEIQK